MARAVDAKATKIARNRQRRGFDRLNAIFGWDPADAALLAEEKRNGYPAAERARRRARGKQQRLSRRRNRL